MENVWIFHPEAVNLAYIFIRENVFRGYGVYHKFQQYFSYIVAHQFYWKRKFEYPEKTTDKLHHIMLYRVHLTWAGFELAMLVVKGTDCVSTYKSNYLTIMTTKAPKMSSTFLLRHNTVSCWFAVENWFWHEIEKIKNFYTYIFQ